MNAAPQHRALLSVADYLAGEESAECRYEYLAGEVYAMSGASVRHNAICLNLASALQRHLAGGPCRAFINDVKVHLKVLNDDYFYYPDVMVACRPEDNASHYREQPCLLVEVMSESTKRVDRREKLLAYREIPALETYVLIGQQAPEVSIYRRAVGWMPERLSADGVIALPDLDFRLSVAELYAGTEGL
ncbi:MAG: Uma2 family endonuclease [Rhodocyclaceae bacterium]|nr:Uma2 family endonuclease [Rhodocyclaceae bacterium]